jgi:hypothetical protein
MLLYPPPRVFLQKSVDLVDCKGLGVFSDDKQFATVSNKRICYRDS